MSAFHENTCSSKENLGNSRNGREYNSADDRSQSAGNYEN